MKKVHCNYSPEDYIQVHEPSVYGSVDVVISEATNTCSVELKPEGIRKLRKQLKKALKKIEGETE